MKLTPFQQMVLSFVPSIKYAQFPQELANKLGKTPAAVSKALYVLQDAGLVESKIKTSSVNYSSGMIRGSAAFGLTVAGRKLVDENDAKEEARS